MLRAAALFTLLTFTGSPAAEAVCLVRCAGSCPPSSSAPSTTASARASASDCAPAIGATPALTESVQARAALREPIGQAVAPILPGMSLSLANRSLFPGHPYEEPPPGHRPSLLVLRL